MRQCLSVTFSGDYPDGFLRDFIQKHAREFNLEGTAQWSHDGLIHIVVCGNKEHVDAFLDLVHKGSNGVLPEDISVEPFVREKDYRGIFRVIE
ncbi:acylphosphatase [Candidatus Dependentiae bacterium]|nr:acylphosphatase [Candidatus Dependentiae bacterium]MCC7415252.1 acylphosphatase [Campylobacterota bacterium]